MLTISQLVIIALILSVAVIIFAIFEMFHLASLSSIIANLETLIEKKSQEFDQFKRERANPPQPQPVVSQQSFPIEPTPLEDTDHSGQIQIIRNIGGTFKDTSQIDYNNHTLASFSQKNSTPQVQSITLYLYSNVSKDADFDVLWNTLSSYLKSDAALAVTIDFTGIDFIYENEIHYLDEIVKIVESKQGSMVFTNCSSDVAALMQSHPRLISRIKCN